MDPRKEGRDPEPMRGGDDAGDDGAAEMGGKRRQLQHSKISEQRLMAGPGALYQVADDR